MQRWPAFCIALLCLGLVACDKASDNGKAERTAQRRQAIAETVKAGPQTKSWDTPEGTVIELTLPRAALGGSFVEVKRCTVWRDAVTKTSSMQCDREEIDLGANPTDKPDVDPR